MLVVRLSSVASQAALSRLQVRLVVLAVNGVPSRASLLVTHNHASRLRTGSSDAAAAVGGTSTSAAGGSSSGSGDDDDLAQLADDPELSAYLEVGGWVHVCFGGCVSQQKSSCR